MRKTNLLAALAMPATLFFTACQKEQAENIISSTTKTFPMPSNGGFRSLPTMPSVQNGMLKFTDQAHFDEYLAYLDALVMDEPQTENETDTDSTEFDDKLLQVETNLSFSSLRAKLVADFEILNEEGFSTIEEIPAEHFVPSSCLRSILNENLEAKIGNSIFVYYNEDWLIEITDGDVETRDEIRSIRKQFPNELGEDIYFLDDLKIKNLKGAQVSMLKSGGESLELVAQPVNCATPLTRVFKASIKKRTFPTRFEWTINGNSIIQNVSAGETTLTFTFPSAGTYTISLDAFNTFTGANALMFSHQQTITVSSTSCVPNNLSSTTQWNYCNGRAYSSFIRKYSPLFTSLDTRYNAVTKSYTWNGSVWRHRDIERISVQLWATTHDPDNNCAMLDTDFGSVWPSNARTAERDFRLTGNATQNNGLYSIHGVRHNNQNCSVTRFLQSCP